MERVKALADKFIEQLAQNVDSAVLRQTAIQILSELESIPTMNQLPNNVSVIMPSVDYTQNTPVIEKQVLMGKPKQVFEQEAIIEKKEVADKIALDPIKDLRAAIGINDKFQFVETLFNNEEVVFETSIKTINAFKNFAEAQFWVKQNLRNKYHWEEESTVVMAFDQLVKRRFF